MSSSMVGSAEISLWQRHTSSAGSAASRVRPQSHQMAPVGRVAVDQASARRDQRDRIVGEARQGGGRLAHHLVGRHARGPSYVPQPLDRVHEADATGAGGQKPGLKIMTMRSRTAAGA